MNKKFSTLVAMLLASGGLFYAVDAMVLPGSEGVAKYVMVETRAAAQPANYAAKVVTVADVSTEFDALKIWKLETSDQAFVLKTVDKGSVLCKDANGAVVLVEKTGDISGAIQFTFDADGLLKSGEDYLVINGDKLELAITIAAGAKGVAAFTNASTVVTVATGQCALGQAVVTKPVALSTNNVGVQISENDAAVFATGSASANFSSALSVDVEKIGDAFYLKVGKDQYLANHEEITVVVKAALVEATDAITVTSGKVSMGGSALYLKNNAITTNTSANDEIYIAKSIESWASNMTSGTHYYADDTGLTDGVTGAVLFTPNAGNTDDMTSNTPLFLKTVTAPTVNALGGATLSSTFGALGATEKVSMDADGKIRCGSFYLRAAASKNQAVTAQFGSVDATVFAIDANGVISATVEGEKCTLVNNSSAIKLVETPEADEMLYFYTAADEYAKTVAAVDGALANLITTVANIEDGASMVSATEQDAVAATPGAEIPGMENVEFEGSNIKLTAGAEALPTPIYLKANGGFISLNKANDGLIFVTKADADATASKKASWVLVDGRYMSVAMDEAGKDAKYLKFEAAVPVAETPETPATGYSLVTKDAATKATFNGSANVSFAAATLNMNVSKTLSAAPEKSGKQERVDAVGGGYVLLSVGNGEYISFDGTAVSTTTNPSDANALWLVKQTQPAKDAPYTYSFTNKNEKLLAIGGATVFSTNSGFAYDKGFILSANEKFVNVSSSVTLEATGSILGLYEVGENKFSADELTIKRGHGFDVIIAVANTPEASTDIEENPFTGVLTPVDVNYKEATSGNNFYLRNAAGEYIVLDLSATWGGTTENTLNGKNSWNRGYKFTTVSEATFKSDVVGHTDKYKYVFSVSHSAGVAAKDSKEALIDIYTGTLNGVGTVFGRLYVAELKNNAEVSYVLTTTNGFVDATKEHYPYVIFGSTNMAKQKDLAKGKFITVSKKTDIAHKLDGFTQVLTVVTDVNSKTTAAFVDVANAVADTLPASQWAVKHFGTDGITLTNREFPSVTYTDFGKGLYTIEDKANDFAVASNLNDTVRIKFHDSVTPYDGYANFDGIDVRDNLFKIGLISPVFGETAYLSENHGTDHQLGFVNDENEATQWTLAKMTSGRHMEKVTKTDTIYVVSTFDIWKDNGWKPKNDTLKITPFYFINSNNGEAIVWGKNAQNTNPSGVNKNPEAYICNPNTTAKLKETAQAFVLKINGKGYNLVAVDYNTEATLNNYTWNALTNNLESLNKMYAGVSSDKGITNRDYSYRKTENDIFSITPVAAEMYRKVSMGDTIKFFREDNEADILFEKGYNEGNFLARVNEVQFPKSAPAMFVDTAYVDRANNNRWEYLLVVEPERKISKVECAIEDHPKHYADTTYGRFLVNLIDSANIYNQSQELHNNKYVNSEGYAKLAFVRGYHTHDTLYLDCVKHTVDTISLDRQVNAYGVETAPRSVAKFAFRIIDQNTKSFVIETQYKKFANKTPNAAYEGAPGYLKWMNDYIVVVPNIKDADVFNMEENYAGDPTANENVTVSGISVAATNGAVIIKGAEGKKVSIVNVLGQSIANTVITSSEATIAAPAGVVVVSVEGEAAVKAIVK